MGKNRIYKVIGILPIFVLLIVVTNIIMGKNEIILSIIAIWVAIIAIILTVSKKTWRSIIISHLSPIICYGILKIYFYYHGVNFNLWKPKEYTWDNLDYFFHDGIFYWSLGINIFSFLFFSFLLPIIPKFFYKKIYNRYLKMLRIKRMKDKIKSAAEMGERHREFLNPSNPKEEKIYDKSRDKEFEYDLHIWNKNVSLIIQFLFCIMIFSPMKWLFVPIIFILILLMIVVRPLYRAIISREYK